MNVFVKEGHSEITTAGGEVETGTPTRGELFGNSQLVDKNVKNFSLNLQV